HLQKLHETKLRAPFLELLVS
ncbi:hypothetical protein CP03DC29_0773B, partial [Chlamydia psittaci 03DC29]